MKEELERVARKIKAARKRIGLTQAELGKLVNRSQTLVWEWENARKEPPGLIMLKLCKILGIKM